MKYTQEDIFPSFALDKHAAEDFAVGVPKNILFHFRSRGISYEMNICNTGEECVILKKTYRIFKMTSNVESHKIMTDVPLLVDNNMHFPPQYVSDAMIMPRLSQVFLDEFVNKVRSLPQPIRLFDFFSREHMFGTPRLASHTHVRQYITAFLEYFNKMPRLPLSKPIPMIQKKMAPKKESGYSYSIFARHPTSIHECGKISVRGIPMHLRIVASTGRDALFTNLPLTVFVSNGTIYRATNCSMQKQQHDAFVTAFRNCEEPLPFDIHAFYLSSTVYKGMKYEYLPSHALFRKWIDELADQEEKDESIEDIVDPECMEVSDESEQPSSEREQSQPHLEMEQPQPPFEMEQPQPPPEMEQHEMDQHQSHEMEQQIALTPVPIAFRVPREALHLYVTHAIFGEDVSKDAFARLCSHSDHAARYGMKEHRKVSSIQEVVASMAPFQRQPIPYLVFVQLTAEQVAVLPAAYEKMEYARKGMNKLEAAAPIMHEKYESDKASYSDDFIAFLQRQQQQKNAYIAALQEFSKLQKEVLLYFAVWRTTSNAEEEVIVQWF